MIHSDDAADIATRVVQRLRATRADALNVRVHVAGLDPAGRARTDRGVRPRGVAAAARGVAVVSDAAPARRRGPRRAADVSIGAELAVTVRPYVEYATVDSMRNFARAYGDDNPLFG